MKVDHVIPESTLNNVTEARILRDRFALPEDFNILGYENLAPCCNRCNSDKSDLLLRAGYISIVLARVEARIPAVKEFFAKRRAERDLDTTLRYIARSIEAKKFSSEELIKGLEWLRKFPGGIRGRGSAGPPESPEEREGIYLPDRTEIVWSRHATERAVQRDISATTVYEALKNGKLLASGLSEKSVYSLQFGNMSVIYRVDENRVTILSVHYT
jgi:hypothetical protein